MSLNEEEFQEWLADMDLVIDALLVKMPRAMRPFFDHSVESLDVLETWLLARYKHNDLMLKKSESIILDGCARYIGETYRHHLGGHWFIDRKHNCYDGLPLVGGFGEFVAPLCPLTLATTSVDRRRGDFISTILRKQIKLQREQKPFEFHLELEE